MMSRVASTSPPGVSRISTRAEADLFSASITALSILAAVPAVIISSMFRVNTRGLPEASPREEIAPAMGTKIIAAISINVNSCFMSAPTFTHYPAY